jgi:hypothetical protein
MWIREIERYVNAFGILFMESLMIQFCSLKSQGVPTTLIAVCAGKCPSSSQSACFEFTRLPPRRNFRRYEPTPPILPLPAHDHVLPFIQHRAYQRHARLYCRRRRDLPPREEDRSSTCSCETSLTRTPTSSAAWTRRVTLAMRGRRGGSLHFANFFLMG